VEGLVGYPRRNFLVAIPRWSNWQELNAQLIHQCRDRRAQPLRGHEPTIGERFQYVHEVVTYVLVKWQHRKPLTTRLRNTAMHLLKL